jgi:hypothetical protein
MIHVAAHLHAVKEVCATCELLQAAAIVAAVAVVVAAVQPAIAVHPQNSVLRDVNLRNHWWGGSRKRINQKGSAPGNAIVSGDSP